MENYVTGQGGDVFVNATKRPVAEWKLEQTEILTETTTSASGCKRRQSILPDAAWDFSTPWDLDQVPETIGIRRGNIITALKLVIGNSGMMYPPFKAIIEKCSIVNDPKADVTRLVVSGYALEIVGDPVPVA